MIRFVFLLLLLAAALYGVFWAIDRRSSAGPTGPVKPRPRGPLGPDDDVDFLRNLDLHRDRPNPGAAPDPNPPQDPPAPGTPPSSQETHDHPE